MFQKQHVIVYTCVSIQFSVLLRNVQISYIQKVHISGTYRLQNKLYSFYACTFDNVHPSSRTV